VANGAPSHEGRGLEQAKPLQPEAELTRAGRRSTTDRATDAKPTTGVQEGSGFARARSPAKAGEPRTRAKASAFARR